MFSSTKVCKFCDKEFSKIDYKEHKLKCPFNKKNRMCATCTKGRRMKSTCQCLITGKIKSNKSTCEQYTNKPVK